MTPSKISCETMSQFLNTVAGLVERGIRFEAFPASLTIELTGGY